MFTALLFTALLFTVLLFTALLFTLQGASRAALSKLNGRLRYSGAAAVALHAQLSYSQLSYS